MKAFWTRHSTEAHYCYGCRAKRGRELEAVRLGYQMSGDPLVNILIDGSRKDLSVEELMAALASVQSIQKSKGEESASGGDSIPAAPHAKAAIRDLALDNPNWTDARIASAAKELGLGVAAKLIPQVLAEASLATAPQRWIKLEKMAKDGAQLTGEQIAFVEKSNPAFVERDTAVSRPGELLLQDVIYLGNRGGLGPAFLHLAVDAFSGLTFALLHTTRRSEAGVALLCNKALPFFKNRGIRVSQIECSTELIGSGVLDPMGVYLGIMGIDHRRQPRTKNRNGFVERAYLNISTKWRNNPAFLLTSMELNDMESSLDAWLATENRNGQAEGYPNYGVPPLQMLERRHLTPPRIAPAWAIRGGGAASSGFSQQPTARGRCRRPGGWPAGRPGRGGPAVG
ncbi:MAG: hypothetical protein EXR51_05175 [Dehalococcoidia bacterium]|nr:hypothetical protein [Dehalococcoidia bacterium]